MVAFKSLKHRSQDRQLERRVAAALNAVDPIRFRNVAVSARRGVVVLNGFVASYYVKSLAFQFAAHTDGVEAVIDSLRVSSSERFLEPDATRTAS